MKSITKEQAIEKYKLGNGILLDRGDLVIAYNKGHGKDAVIGDYFGISEDEKFAITNNTQTIFVEYDFVHRYESNYQYRLIKN